LTVDQETGCPSSFSQAWWMSLARIGVAASVMTLYEPQSADSSQPGERPVYNEADPVRALMVCAFVLPRLLAHRSEFPRPYGRTPSNRVLGRAANLEEARYRAGRLRRLRVRAWREGRSSTTGAHAVVSGMAKRQLQPRRSLLPSGARPVALDRLEPKVERR
jgi:hypothetical protein